PTLPPVTRVIDLLPGDWMRATWRPRQPLVKPPLVPRPFDLDAALQYLTTISAGPSSRNWGSSRVPQYQSREEAHFWLWAATQPDDRTPAIQTITKLSEDSFHGWPTFDEIEKRLAGWRHLLTLGDAVLRTLEVLLSSDSILHFLLRAPGWPRVG